MTRLATSNTDFRFSIIGKSEISTGHITPVGFFFILELSLELFLLCANEKKNKEELKLIQLNKSCPRNRKTELVVFYIFDRLKYLLFIGRVLLGIDPAFWLLESSSNADAFQVRLVLFCKDHRQIEA